jgi:hypothetical protein
MWIDQEITPESTKPKGYFRWTPQSGNEREWQTNDGHL